MTLPYPLSRNMVPSEPLPRIERAPLTTAPENRPRYVGDERNAGGLGVGETINDYYRASIGDASQLTPSADGSPGTPSGPASSRGGCCS